MQVVIWNEQIAAKNERNVKYYLPSHENNVFKRKRKKIEKRKNIKRRIVKEKEKEKARKPEEMKKSWLKD